MTSIAPARISLLPQMLHHHATAMPNRNASMDEDTSTTFAELDARASRVAASLIAAGVDVGQTVGLFMASSSRLLVAVWGILRSGGAYLPLAVDYPDERLRYMIVDSGLQHIMVDRASADQVEHLVPGGVNVIVLEDTLGGPALKHEPAVEAESPAYVIYTSGSTGRPKGVVIPHRAIARQLEFLTAFVGLVPGSRILLKTPASFDAAQWEILANAAGATVVVGSPGVHRDPEALIELIRTHSVSVLQCVPTLWNALLETQELGSCSSLESLFSGGEVLPSALARQLLETLPRTTLTNLYGPTETTTNATWNQIRQGEVPDQPAVGIGQAVPACEIHILDQDLSEAPTGQVGELCISGEQLALGYLNKPTLTQDKFVTAHFDGTPRRIYRSGDLARIDKNGGLDFCGRADDQVKVNGHRVETDEVKLAIEAHHWVRQAAVVPYRKGKGGAMHLGAFIEFDSQEAALMDQGVAGEHHRSKASHVQVKAQLAQTALRRNDVAHEDRVALSNPEGTASQRQTAFARKTYRHFEGDPVDREILGDFAESLWSGWPLRPASGPIDVAHLSELLRWLGPFHSDERLLPKFAYASPGALNATRVYVETSGIIGLRPGTYYFHPFEHELHRVSDVQPELGDARVRLHLVGLSEAIESVYSTNVLEVLHMEAGHMAGVLDRAAADLGHHLRQPLREVPTPADAEASWGHTAAFDLIPGLPKVHLHESVRLTLQIHGPVRGLSRGTYDFGSDGLVRIGDEVVERRHVIAINQATYDRSSFGITVSCPRNLGWAGFVEVGRALQKLQMNRLGIGLMSSGYASLSGRNLPSAIRFNEITETPDSDARISYFAVCGSISECQVTSTGMKEDAVHVRGPAEIIKDDLRRQLPYYMVPARVEVLDRLPRSNTTKVDRTALIGILEAQQGRQIEPVAPASNLEAEVLSVTSEILGQQVESVADDFFGIGGNSLSAVRLINALNARFGSKIPVQRIFDAPTVRDLAKCLDCATPTTSTRVVRLAAGAGEPIFIWPGLGGYPMNLRQLAAGVSNGRPVFGIQALGLNAGETPYPTLEKMVAADAELIRAASQNQPVTLMGYSFGARMAAEVASLLEGRGDIVDRLVLIAPGSPKIPDAPDTARATEITFSDPYFRMILMSVFKGTLAGLPGDTELAAVRGESGFLELLASRMPGLDAELAERIVRVVIATYGFRNGPMCRLDTMFQRTQVLIAHGDGPSFVDQYRTYLEAFSAVKDLTADHYEVLRAPAVDATAGAVLPAPDLRV